MGIKFITGEPAILVKDSLVVADLHIGIEQELRRAGVYIPSQLESMASRLDILLERTKAKRLIIIGDVKHRVPGTSYQELREVPGFFQHFTKKVKVEIVPGNHDTNLESLAAGAKIHPSKGMLLDDVYLCHGHAWPSADFLKAEHIIIGHSHPQFEFRNSLGYRWLEPCWLRLPLKRQALVKHFKGVGKASGLPELVLMPAFNHFAGGVAVNRKKRPEELLGPVIKAADMDKGEACLLDGTLLGKISGLLLAD